KCVQIVRVSLIQTFNNSEQLRRARHGTTRALWVCVSGGSVGRLKRGLEPGFRKEDGGSGQKARAGRQPESRQANPCSGETPGISREGFLSVKVEGGGDVKAFPRCTGRGPGGAEAHEGRGSVGTQPVSTHTALEAGSKALK